MMATPEADIEVEVDDGELVERVSDWLTENWDPDLTRTRGCRSEKCSTA